MELLIISILWLLLRNRSFRRATVFVGDALRLGVSKGMEVLQDYLFGAR